jgi:SAM-dependent methyltransferase
MDEALAHWLRLREARDWASRSANLTRDIAGHLASHETVEVLDLGTGTGSNLRYLVERLPPRQRWLLVDRSPDLLSLVFARTAAWATARGYGVRPTPDGFALEGKGLDCRVATRRMDLNLPLDPLLCAGRHLVTGSAILDLVSESWLRALAECCRHAGTAMLFALTYSGQSSLTPREPEDDLLRDLLNAHQLRDKGLGGPATGPAAHAAAEVAFTDAGYLVQATASDWTIDTSEREFQGLLVQGLAGAGLEQRPDLAGAINGWLARRQTHIANGRSQAVVGHYDLVAWPAPR